MVAPRPVTVTSENVTKTYGADDPPFSAKLGNVLSGEENKIEYGFTRVEGEDVKSGGYRITPTGETDQGNYSVTFVPEGVLTINPAKITSATAPNVEYQNAKINPVLTVMAGDLPVPSNAYSVGTWTWSKTAPWSLPT